MEYGEAYVDYSYRESQDAEDLERYGAELAAKEKAKGEERRRALAVIVREAALKKAIGAKNYELKQIKELRAENAKKKRDAANAANAAATTALVTVVDDADDDSSPFMPLSSVGTGVMQPFSAWEQARFAVEVVAQKKDLRLVGKALGRSTKDCVLYYYLHFKHGRKVEYRRLKSAMREVQHEQNYDDDDDDDDDDLHGDEDSDDKDDEENMNGVGGGGGGGELDEGSAGKRARLQSPPPDSVAAQQLLPQRGCRVLVRFDDGTWYGGRVSGFQPGSVSASNTRGGEVTIFYDDGESETAAYPDPDVVVMESSPPPGLCFACAFRDHSAHTCVGGKTCRPTLARTKTTTTTTTAATKRSLPKPIVLVDAQGRVLQEFPDKTSQRRDPREEEVVPLLFRHGTDHHRRRERGGGDPPGGPREERPRRRGRGCRRLQPRGGRAEGGVGAGQAVQGPWRHGGRGGGHPVSRGAPCRAPRRGGLQSCEAS